MGDSLNRLGDDVTRAVAVRRAAIQLARAVMRQGRVRVRDLAEPAPVVAAPVVAHVAAPVAAANPVRAKKPRAVKPVVAVAPVLAPAPAEPAVQHPPTINTEQLKPQGEAVVPAGVKVTICPSGQDMRFRVDPSFTGGAFLADWRAKRGQA